MLVAAVIVSAAVAACGSSTTGALTTAGGTSRTADSPADTSGLGYARCMRAHGVSRFPDPSATGAINRHHR